MALAGRPGGWSGTWWATRGPGFGSGSAIKKRACDKQSPLPLLLLSAAPPPWRTEQDPGVLGPGQRTAGAASY